MPDNKGDESFARDNSDTATFTSPLRVITQYARTDISDMYSLDRSTSLGLCLTNAPNLTDLKSCSLSLHNVSQEVCYQPWTVGSVDTSEFEKLLGRLGNNGSTLTPNSVLNPNNITQDQELFADNFSETLNKVKTEQEVWTLIPSSSSFDNIITESTNSSLEKQIQSNRNVSVSFMESYTISGETSNSVKSKSDHTHPPVYVSDPTKIESPALTNEPLVLLSGTSNENPMKTPSNVNSMQRHIACSKCSSSASDPFHENFYPNILSTCDSNSNDIHRMNTEISWVTSLPTISSIANGLRQAVADCGCSATDFCSSLDELSSESRFTNSSYRHKIIGSHRFSENVLASAKDILCSNDDNDGIHCRLSQKLPVVNPCNHEQSRDIPVHYAIQEDHGAAQMNGLCSEGLEDDVVTLSSTSRLCTNDSSDFGIRIALTELYYSARPNPSTVEERIISTPALSSVTESTDSNPCSENIHRTSAHLFVSCQSTTPRDSSSHLLDNHLNPTSIAGQSPGSSRIHNSDSILSRNDVCLAHPPNSPTNGNLCDQQFDEMYCTLGNQFSDKSLLLQSNSHLIPCISPMCDSFLDAHMLQSLRSPGILSTDLNQVSVNSVLNLTAIPSLLSDENNGDLGQRNNYCRRLSNSKSDTVGITSLSTVTSYLNPFSARSLSLVTHSNCLKKPERHVGGNKKSRFNTLNTNSGLAVVGDSSTDITPIHGIFNDASKSNVKRSRNLRVRGSSDVSCKIHSSVYNDENCSTANPLAYPGESNKLFTGKVESLVTGDTDDSSDHSESLSTGTRHAVRDSTPVSPSDEVEQHHLKLERKRARNRVAARRCRERKISLIRSLENQVAERDAQVRNLEDAVARYRAESEQLRLHVEMLASSYPSLKAELYHFPFLSQPLSSHSQPPQPQ
uniref:BZIP domain-containing protein n=1 Tax=Schistosoma mansoni TaxID=6183 RepID=A0A5K4FBN7_SCHMA